MRPRRSRAFTLVEVMVALAIIALSLTAIASKMSRMIDTSNSMRERTYASWIAQNKITEMRLANVIPEVTTTSGDRHRFFYVEPLVVKGQKIRTDDHLGIVQDIRTRYAGGMTPHIHYEIIDDQGMYLDPGSFS